MNLTKCRVEGELDSDSSISFELGMIYSVDFLLFVIELLDFSDEAEEEDIDDEDEDDGDETSALGRERIILVPEIEFDDIGVISSTRTRCLRFAHSFNVLRRCFALFVACSFLLSSSRSVLQSIICQYRHSSMSF